MFDTLIDRKDGQISGSAKTSVSKHRLQATQDPGRAIRRAENPVHEPGTRQVQALLGNRLALVVEQGSLVAQAHRADKRVYAITPAGRSTLEEWVAAPSEATRLRDDFFLKLAFAHTAGLNSANDPAVLIDRQRRHCLQTLRELNDLSARAEAEGNRTATLLAEGAILHLQADLTWLDLLDDHYKP